MHFKKFIASETFEDTRDELNKKSVKFEKKGKRIFEQSNSDYHPIGISKTITSDVFQVSMTKLFL